MARIFSPEELVFALDRWRVADVMLPFLLIFVIVYAILQKTRILEEGKQNLSVVDAVIVGLLVVVPHVTGRFPPNADPVEIMNNALPQVSLILVAVIFLLMLIGVFGQDYVMLGVSMPGWIAFFSIFVIVLIFGGAAGWWSGYFGETLERFFGQEGVAIAIMLLVFGIIIAWITSDSKEREDRTSMGRFGADFSKLFGKK